ncbi:MAG: SRPBCC domain-containing protein [Jatrophihabitans sp.]
MKLEHSFTVPVGIDDAWTILLDIERIGPCMPGAAINSVDGDDFTGTVKVKLGPIGLTYKGKASFIQKDAGAHRAVIDARGKDARGNGTASAKVTATLSESNGETTVLVHTDLDITGKPAQFGRGMMVDVGNKLIGQFADNLSDTLQADEGDTAAAGDAGAATAEPASDDAALRAVADAPAAYSAPGGSAGDGPSAEVTQATGSASSYAAPAVDGSSLASSSLDGSPADGASVNGTSATAARRTPPEREVQPINLIASAGPAVAKRIAGPLAVGALFILIAARRRRRR